MILKNLQEGTIHNFIGELFDYDRVVEFDCSKTISLTDKEKKDLLKETDVERKSNFLKEKVIEVLQSKFNPNLSEENTEFKDFSIVNNRPVGHIKIERDRPDTLLDISTKHLKIARMICSNFREYLPTKDRFLYEMIESKFLEDKVMEKSDWANCEGVGKHSFRLQLAREMQENVNQQQL
jgi:hypothetical protein